MAVSFITREAKSKFGVPCTEDANGLWIAKGKTPHGLPLEDLLSAEEVSEIQDILVQGRRNRMGRFWIDRASRKVTMMVNSKNNKNKMKTLYY